MSLLRKTGVRSPWLPAPLQGSIERVQPALVVMAVVPTLLLGGNAQFVGRLPRDEDVTRPTRQAVVITQPVPVPGASVWMPRPFDSGAVPEVRLSPPTLLVNQPPMPTGSSLILGMVPRVPTAPAARPMLLVGDPPDPTLVQGAVQFIGRLARDEDVTRPARPAVVITQPVPVPGASVWAPRPLDSGVIAQPDRLSPLTLLVNQPPIPGATSLILGMVPRVPTAPAARPMLVVTEPPDPTLVQAAAVVVGRLPRDEDTTRPARPAVVITWPPPIPGATSLILGMVPRVPTAPAARPMLVRADPPAATLVRAAAQFVGRLPRPAVAPGTPQPLPINTTVVIVAGRVYTVVDNRHYEVAVAARYYRTNAMALVKVVKDPGATLDYQFDWSDQAASDAITGSAWAADAGITVSSSSNTTTTTAVRLTGGTLGQTYKVKNTVTFTSGQIDVRRLLVTLQEL